MKKFVLVFVLLLSVNLFVPTIYYHTYYGSSAEQAETQDFFTDISKTDNNTTDNNTENINTNYTLYNLETHQLQEMDLISFLVGSAACEMPASYEMEAIKAQMIACHSYYLYCKQNGVPHDDLNLSYDQRYMSKYASKERLQEYWGVAFDEHYQKFLRCAEEVKDLIVAYKDDVALTTYYAVSCGKTQPSKDEWGADFEYLTCVESETDVLSDIYLKVKSFTMQEFYDRLMTSFSGLKLDLENPDKWISNVTYNSAGYVSAVDIGGLTILGRDFRKYFELNSSCFMVFYEDDEFSIATKGYGHGVGMSQFGANQLSQQGKTYKDILLYYYPGTDIKKL